MIERFWKNYSFYVHLAGWLVTLAFTGGVVWASVSGYDMRITANTSDITDIAAKQESQQKTLDRMDYNVQIIAQKVGVKPLRKPDD